MQFEDNSFELFFTAGPILTNGLWVGVCIIEFRGESKKSSLWYQYSYALHIDNSTLCLLGIGG